MYTFIINEAYHIVSKEDDFFIDITTLNHVHEETSFIKYEDKIYHNLSKPADSLILEKYSDIISGDVCVEEFKISLETRIQTLKSQLKQELNEACKQAIHSGIDIEINGKTKQFSLTDDDQTNIQGLYNDLLLVQQGQFSMLGIIIKESIPYVPYHANGGFCEYYSAQEWIEIVSKVSAHKLYHTTYINMLHRYMDDIADYNTLLEIQYGVTLPKKYNDHLLFITTGGKKGKLIESE